MFNREWGKKHRDAGRQESTKEWRAALERIGLSPEQKAKLEQALAEKRAERERKPA